MNNIILQQEYHYEEAKINQLNIPQITIYYQNSKFWKDYCSILPYETAKLQ